MEVATKYAVIGLGSLLFVLVVFGDVFGFVGAINGMRANATVETDTLRLAQTMEVMDHRPGETMKIRFEGGYDEIGVSKDEVWLKGSAEKRYNIYVERSVDGGTMSGGTVCVVNEGTRLTVAETC